MSVPKLQSAELVPFIHGVEFGVLQLLVVDWFLLFVAKHTAANMWWLARGVLFGITVHLGVKQGKLWHYVGLSLLRAVQGSGG